MTFLHNESFAFSGTLRCAHDALRLAAKKSVRRNPDCATLWRFRVIV
ncbi:hypothetical protein [Marinomonas sp. ef1]|nr:hypothetical protein [Marinomonas sp. ef1]